MQQESTTTHFTLGFICIFVNSDSPTGAAVYFSHKVSIYMTFDICGGIFIHLKFPHWIISYSTNLKWSENKHRSHENICSNECRESWCLHHKCLKSTWKLTVSLFLPKGGNLRNNSLATVYETNTTYSAQAHWKSKFHLILGDLLEDPTNLDQQTLKFLEGSPCIFFRTLLIILIITINLLLLLICFSYF